MRYRYLTIAVLIVLLALSGSGAVVLAQATETPTNTPTNTLTPTPTPANNATNIFYATPAPPSACGSPFNPCGAIPFPMLWIVSPTLRPTIPTPTLVPITATPSYTFTPSATSATWTPSPTATIEPEGEGLATLVDEFDGLSQTIVAQSTAQIVIAGTPQGAREVAQSLGESAGQLFAIGRALGGSNWGGGGIINALFTMAGFVLIVLTITFFGPILLRLLRIIIQLIDLIVPF